MNIAQQIEYAGQVKNRLANMLEDTTGIDNIIGSLRTLQSVTTNKPGDSYVVEMKQEDFRQFQEYKKFKEFTGCNCLQKQPEPAQEPEQERRHFAPPVKRKLSFNILKKSSR
ncbi:hypothetical protein SDC9_17659 [bioreactor metagenome]|jgi:hypothetical protein|uniref:Uncharacterized protein n=1 Tax=bioreactor metagenome TaxID=1076179 RepID=A0A644TYA7_9ZZZZ|nr:hypothetical protein [Lentimicrobium sp.]MEA5111703.1 hypothetical protein [Lentimicrobium sp.]